MRMRWSKRPDDTSYYHYIARHVVDLTIVTLDPEKILDELKGHRYKLKGGSAPADTFLGATTGVITFQMAAVMHGISLRRTTSGKR